MFVNPTSYIDTTCQGDTSFKTIRFRNPSAFPTQIDSIVVPAGFGKKDTYPQTIPVGDSIALTFFHSAGTIGTFSDTFYMYTNAANVPRPFKFFARVVVKPSPTATFSINDTAQCLRRNSFVFTNGSTISSGTLTYDWFLGDINQSSNTNVTHTYATADTFDVTLIATSDLACNDFITKQVIAFPMPVAKIQVNDSDQCLKFNRFDFIDSTKIESGTYSVNWQFGDGNSSTQGAPSHSYITDSVFFPVRLIATSDQTCIDTARGRSYVFPMPVVQFSINDSTQCRNGNSFQFTNASTVKTGALSYVWLFGDGNTSTQTSPTHVYANATVNTVSLIATTVNNCKDTLQKSAYIYAHPTVAFTINDSTQCLRNNSFSFNNTSSITPLDTPLTYVWDFGDAAGTSTDKSPVYAYSAAGNYPAKVVATSTKGCKDSLSKNVFVYVHPLADFSINDSAQCINTHNFAFTNNTTMPPTPGNIISGYSWRFGNGDTSNVQHPTKNDYSSPDTLTVLLIARSNNVCYDTARHQVIIFPVPQLNIAVNDTSQCFNNNLFQFDDNSTITSGLLTYNWQFGDGGSSQQGDTSYHYPTISPTYNVTFRATSDQGCFEDSTFTTYLFANPTADFIVLDSAQCLRNNSFDFVDNSAPGTGTITHFWEFGDGNTSTAASPTHPYNYSDTFEVELTVINSEACEDSLIKQVIVFPHPATKFKVDNQSQCFVGHQFNFRDTSTIPYGTLTYNWDFGDGSSVTGTTTPSKSYMTADTFDITYTVTSDQGCDSTVFGQVYVYASPVAGFVTNDSTQCLPGNQFDYINTSTVSEGTMFYTWNYGNSVTSSSEDGSVVYSNTDTFTVKLIVSTDKNCKDSATHTSIVFPSPDVKFTVNKDKQCFLNNSFRLKNTSTIEYGTMTFNWDLGDGNTSALDSFVHSYASADTFNVELRATSNNGCADTARQNMFVYPDPIADFVINDSSQCIVGNSFIFTDNSFISSGTITYFWTFGDFGNDNTSSPPPHTYTTADTFDVRLLITSNLACRDTLTKQVIVTPSPDPTFTGLAPQLCFNGPAVTLIPATPGGAFSGDNVSGSDFSPAQLGWNVVEHAVTINGCSDTARDSTFVVPAPSFDLGPDTVFCQEDFYTLNVTTPGATYFWSADSSKNASFTITGPGLYVVTVTNACGSVSDSVNVRYLDFACDMFIPNAFTPEGNTVNDFFVPFIDTTVVKGIEFLVYDRWGTEVFATTDMQTKGWDGTFNGAPSPEGVYIYLIKMTLIREDVRRLKSVKGNFTLLR